MPYWGGSPLFVVHTVDHKADTATLVDIDRVTRFVLERAGGGWNEDQTAQAMEQMHGLQRGDTYKTNLLQGGRITIDILARST